MHVENNYLGGILDSHSQSLYFFVNKDFVMRRKSLIYMWVFWKVGSDNNCNVATGLFCMASLDPVR